MEFVQNLKWKKGITVKEMGEQFGKAGFQATEIGRATEIITKMKREKAKIYFTFTSNMVTSGLRGFFAQMIKLGMADVIITTVGGIEEDMMKALGEGFVLGSFYSDDLELYEKGLNRVGNIMIPNKSYEKFEDSIGQILAEVYEKKKRISSAELLQEIGSRLKDENSILFQAAKRKVPIFCPAITDGALGFHLQMFQTKHSDFIVDVIRDFSELLAVSDYDEKKGLVGLGGGVSKHYAILGTLINGGMDYAVYITTSRPTSGSMSGATTQEAKSWGKVKDDADAVTVVGDATLLFPLAMIPALEELDKEGVLNQE